MEKSFGDRLRELRIARDKSMGQVAREIGVTTVYYSQVENGKMPPFPAKKVDYRVLAATLSQDPQAQEALGAELHAVAMNSRGRVEINLQHAREQAKNVALQFARKVSDSSLTDEQLEKIRKVLEGE